MLVYETLQNAYVNSVRCPEENGRCVKNDNGGRALCLKKARYCAGIRLIVEKETARPGPLDAV